MSRLLLSLSLLAAFLVVSSASPAIAQPSAYAPPPPLQLQLSDEDLAVLDRGQISVGQYIAGGAIGTHFGFGIGHMVQQRWMDKGWIFTIGESAAIAAMIAGIVSCEDDYNDTYYNDPSHKAPRSSSGDSCSEGLIIGGAIGFVGLRIWEVIDLWVAPPAHNRRLKKLKANGQAGYRFSIAPTGSGSGVASLSLDF